MLLIIYLKERASVPLATRIQDVEGTPKEVQLVEFLNIITTAPGQMCTSIFAPILTLKEGEKNPLK